MNPPSERLSAADAAKMFVGSRLTLARQLAGMKKNELAESIGKTPTAIASYEAGRSRPAASTVARLCIALGVEPDFFLATAGTERSEANSLEPHYRSLRSTTQLIRNQATAYGWIVNDAVAVFERHVEMPPLDLPMDTPSGHGEISRPAVAARALRAAWGLGNEPVRHLLRTAENHGIICVFSPFQIASVDAYSFESGLRPIIILNPLKGDYYRQRWDLAHEIGHLVLHRDAEPGDHTAETEAHRFAAEMLLPGDRIREQLPRRPIWPRLQALKEHWGVSMQALLYRARELGIYSDVTYRNAMMRMSKEGWRRQEPGVRPSVEQPSLLPGALKLLEDAGVSALQLASEARIPMKIFRIVTARSIEEIDTGQIMQVPRAESDGEHQWTETMSLLLTGPI